MTRKSAWLSLFSRLGAMISKVTRQLNECPRKTLEFEAPRGKDLTVVMHRSGEPAARHLHKKE
jgi:hypothetical protein